MLSVLGVWVYSFLCVCFVGPLSVLMPQQCFTDATLAYGGKCPFQYADQLLKSLFWRTGITSGGGKKWLDSGYILKEMLTEFADGLRVCKVRERS